MPQITINSKKIYIIIIYVLVIFIIYCLGRHSKETFTDIPQASNITSSLESTKVIKSIGTTLNDNSNVAKTALEFTAVRSQNVRTMPSAYPDNDFNNPAWIKYRTYLGAIQNQGFCGACWSFSTSSALADRFALLSAGKVKVELSAAKMVMCSFKYSQLYQGIKQGLNPVLQNTPASQEFFKQLEDTLKTSISCQGNDLYSAAKEAFVFGLFSSSCVPYNNQNTNDPVKYNLGASSLGSNIPNCWSVVGNDFDTCADQKTAARIYRASDIYTISATENDIMQELFRRGPVAGGMRVYSNFMSPYDGKTVYMGPNKDAQGNITDTVVGGHAIRIVGWGSENGVNYWWIANSWGLTWGISGYFKMKRMIPECILETNIVACRPEFPGKPLWTTSYDIYEPVDVDLRNNENHNLDTDLFYYNTAIAKIKAKTLIGDLTPIITRSELPNGGDFTNFYVADLILDQSLSLIPTSIFKKVNSRFIYVILLIIGIFIILILPIH
jgi:hypothetical protein